MTRLVFLAVLASAAPAWADGDVGVVVTGEPTLQPQLAAQIQSWLEKHGHALSPAPLVPEAINTLEDCFTLEDESCARRVVEKRSKTKSVVYAKVSKKADEPDTVMITAYWFEKGRDANADRRFCERCSDVTMRSTADELMAALTVNIGKDAGTLKCSSNPAGARVIIDGAPIGVTPLTYAMRTGSHTVTVTRDDMHDDTRDVTIKKGETTEVMFSLEVRASSTNLVPYAVIATGAALVIGGAVLFAVDEDVPAPMGQQKEFYSNTAPLGVGLVVGGLVVGGVGGYLLFRGKQRESTPVAAVTSDTTYFGWAGRF